MIERIKKQFVAVGYTDIEAESLSALIQANAVTWSRLMKRPVEEYYEKYVFEIRKGEDAERGGRCRVLHQYAGVTAQTAALDKLAVAKELADRGRDNEDIRRQLGWFQGMDGKWRFEIDDSKSVFGGPMAEVVARRHLAYGDMSRYVSDRLGLNRPIHLKDILDHPDLYAAYPQLMEIGVAALPAKYMKSRRAYMSAGRGSYNVFVNEEIPALTAQKSIHHELQHVIQFIEDFARGTSPERVLEARAQDEHRKLRDAMEMFPGATSSFRALNQFRLELQGRYGMEWGQLASEDELAHFNALEADILSIEGGFTIMDADFERGRYLAAADEQNIQEREYYGTAGEIEARDAADRINLPSEKRMEFPPDLRDGAFIVWGDSEVAYDATQLPEPQSVSMAGIMLLDEARRASGMWKDLGTKSPFFKKWFAGSKAVDEKGSPLVLYHGGKAGIEVFGRTEIERDELVAEWKRTTRISDDEEYNLRHPIFFFSESEGVAESYRTYNYDYDESDVYACYVSMQNPVDARNPEAGLAAINELLGENETFESLHEQCPSMDSPGLLLHHHIKDCGFGLIKAARENGHDGIIFYDTGTRGYWTGMASFVAFEASQIKSVDNIGTFDRDDVRILYQSRAATEESPAWAGFGDRKIREHASYGRHFARIPIDDFLHLTTAEYETEATLRVQGPRTSNIEPYHEISREFDPTEFDQLPEYAVPFLSVDVDTGEILGHEGRHRAVLLKDAGATTMPIMVKARGKGDRNKLPSTWIGQFDELRTVEAPVSVESRQPIEQIRKIVGEESRVLYQTSLGFFSPLYRAVEGFDFKAMPANQLLQRIRKTPGIKQEELDDLGLVEWLEGLRRIKVHKKQVLSFISDGGPTLVEVARGTSYDADSFESAYNEMREQLARCNALTDENQEFLDKWLENPSVDNTHDVQEILAAEELFYEDFFTHGVVDQWSRGDTKYSRYQLPGGKNYREILITTPTTPRKQFFIAYRGGATIGTGYDSEAEAFQEMKEAFPDRNDLEVRPGEGEHSTREAGYKSSHWRERNVLVHVRLNDRIDDDGNKVLFIEEIQSDWHQEGRLKGYRGDPLQYGSKIVGYTPKGYSWAKTIRPEKSYVIHHLVDPTGNIVAEGSDREEALKRSGLDPNAPDAPFKKSWQMLAFKRVLRMAAEEGYHAVSWTTGEMQIERYDLSKQVEDIEWYSASGMPDNHRALVVNPRDNATSQAPTFDFDAETGVIVNSQYKEKQLSEVVGKDLADKILTGGQSGKLSGLDLKVGGAGMKGFYDAILPKALAKYLKKLDKDSTVARKRVAVRSDASEAGYNGQPLEVGDWAFYVDPLKDFPVWLRSDQVVAYGRQRGNPLRKATKDDFPEVYKEAWTAPITEKVRAAVLAGQPYYQAAVDETKLGMAQIARSGHSVLAFFDGMDISTGVHEPMHVFRQVLEDMAMSEDAPEQVCEDWLATCRYVGARPGHMWSEEQEEKFARAGEAYLAEGVAPSPELERVFERFKQWLTELFEKIFAARPELNDEIRGVFDRLLTAPDEETASQRLM